MIIAPLEYVVIGFQDDAFTNEILPELNALQAKGNVRVVDLIFVMKDAEGAVALQEVSELEEEGYSGIKEDLLGLFTAQDIENLTRAIPAGTSAVIVLLEHTWALGLTRAIREAGGVLFTGGMVPQTALDQLEKELAAEKEESNA